VQEAYAVALDRWPRDGVPAAPGGWILTTAKRRAIDRLRRERVGAEKVVQLAREAEAGLEELPQEDDPIPDERLELIFACCHPALRLEAQVPLTLRLFGGLTVAEIARGLLLPEPTVHQRLVRAKRKVRASGIPLRVPPADELPERLNAVLHVLYLVFNEAHLGRAELAGEAIRLGRVVAALLPREPEPQGLLALMLLTEARRPARTDAEGGLVRLTHQDRSLWTQALIGEGLPLVRRALRSGRPGPFTLQAAIAAVHAEAVHPEDTDWAQIVALYGELIRVAPSPVVQLNRAVAVAEAYGPGAALATVDSLVEPLAGYHLLHATRADLLRRLDRREEAAAAYRQALALAVNEPERQFLAARAAECEGWT
jgi:RNA polymerase sigma-70 factor, ECF subfamily